MVPWTKPDTLTLHKTPPNYNEMGNASIGQKDDTVAWKY